MVRRLILLLALASLLAPVAAANQHFSFAGVTVDTWHFEYGSGFCDFGDPDYYGYHRYTVELDTTDEWRQVYVENDCEAHADGRFSSDLRVRYIERDRETNDWDWLFVDWYGSDTPSGSTCTISWSTLSEEETPELRGSEPCPARPPTVLLLP